MSVISKSDVITDHYGHYWRDRQKVWRYTITGEPVPGARERQLFDRLHNYPRQVIDGVTYVVIPAYRLSIMPELIPYAAHASSLEEVHDGVAERYFVAEGVWPKDLDPGGGVWAPELVRDQLLDAAGFAEVMDWTERGGEHRVHHYVCQGRAPIPVVKDPHRGPRGRSRNWWTAPILEAYRQLYPAARELALAKTMAHAQACRMERVAARRLAQLAHKL